MQRLFFRASALIVVFFTSPAAIAADPPAATLTPDSGPIVYTIAPFVSSNPTPVPLVETGPTCDDPAPECDNFELTVDLPAGFTADNPGAVIKATLEWEALSGGGDYDFYIYTGQVGATDGGDTPSFSGASAANPERTQISPLADGASIYTIKTVPYVNGAEPVQVTIELDTGGDFSLDPTFGQADPVVPNAPRFQTFAPPNGVGGEASNGEFNIGFNPNTGKIMTMAFLAGNVLRITTPEDLDEPLPEACQARWEDATPAATSQPQPVGDPIMFTDNVSGRTWASNLTVGPNVSYAYTDDDGESWINAGVSGAAGADHQTIGSGPYPADSLIPHPLHENAVYFCSQGLVGPAGCVRSDDGGATYGPTVLAYDGSVCGGLHGHVRVADNGAVWLPVEECGTGTGASVSLDAGQTWRDFMIPSTADQGTSGSDPSVALDDDSNAYFCYSNGDGTMRATVSRDNGETWENDIDIGASHGIVNSAFPEAWGGTPGRAACAFIATNVPGNFQSIEFPGLWYGFVSYTYDFGETWTTVNVTPNDPVQGIGGVWQGGGSNPNRNLLDFNEVTADDEGRFIFGYDDGCVRDCATDPRGNPQSFTAVQKVARQTGGMFLDEAFDVPEPRAPANPCLGGVRTQFASDLVWAAPDHGGAEISNYRVFRSESPDVEGTFIGDAGPRTAFRDASADPNVPTYHYTVTAVNSEGESIASNRVDLDVTEIEIENQCVVPGLTLLTDASGDFDSALAAPGTDQNDLLLLMAAQPEVSDGVTKLVFSLKVADLTEPLMPEAAWFVTFRSPDDELRGVRMSTDAAGTPTFFSYVVGESNGGIRDGRFVGETGPVEPESTFSADGVITFVVKATDVGGTGAVGEEYREFNSGTVQRIGTAPGPSAADVVDAMPDGLARTGSFVLEVNGQCPDVGGAAPPPVTPTDPTDPPIASPVPTDQRGSGSGGAWSGLGLMVLAFAALRRRQRRTA